jgi:hypothetical protein
LDEERLWKNPDLLSEPAAHPYRRCSGCGSIHPQDLLAFLREDGVTLETADWKYGYPHKIYVEGIANPLHGKKVIIGSRHQNGKSFVVVGDAPKHTWAKFYVIHLRDLEEETFAPLTKLLEQKVRIKFTRDEKGLRYQSV